MINQRWLNAVRITAMLPAALVAPSDEQERLETDRPYLEGSEFADHDQISIESDGEYSPTLRDFRGPRFSRHFSAAFDSPGFYERHFGKNWEALVPFRVMHVPGGWIPIRKLDA